MRPSPLLFHIPLRSGERKWALAAAKNAKVKFECTYAYHEREFRLWLSQYLITDSGRESPLLSFRP
jgi:hypothetical protein